MFIIKKTRIFHPNKTAIQVTVFTPDYKNKKTPLVIMLTGDGPKGSKSLTWSNLAEKLSTQGIATLLFDFSGLGDSDGLRANLTLTQGIADFELVFKYVQTLNYIDKKNIGILASSFGASVALNCYNIINSVKALGLKSPCCFLPDAYINEISEHSLEEWVNTNYCRENQYNLNVLLDPFSYNTYESAKKIDTPCLITHGVEDKIVPISQSNYLNILLKCRHEFKMFHNCDHGYTTADNWDKMAAVFVQFFTQELIGDFND